MRIKNFQPKKQSVKDALEQFAEGAFQASQLGLTLALWREMIEKRAEIVLTLSGALVPAGLRTCVVECIRNKWVNAIVSTGANITHDLAASFGEDYLCWKGESDEHLRRKKTSRIYDIATPDKSSVTFEKEMQKLLAALPQKEYTPSQLLREIGLQIKDKNSFVTEAAKHDIPIFCPALSDSILGIQVWMFQQDNELSVNELGDVGVLIDYMYSLRKAKKKTGLIVLGGGVSKNFALQAALIPEKPYDYAIQITSDVPQYGGLSGATLEEAVSWGKIKPKAKTAVVYCDATIAFPLLVSALKEKKGLNIL